MNMYEKFYDEIKAIYDMAELFNVDNKELIETSGVQTKKVQNKVYKKIVSKQDDVFFLLFFLTFFGVVFLFFIVIWFLSIF